MSDSEQDRAGANFYKYRPMADPGVMRWVEHMVLHASLSSAAHSLDIKKRGG